MNYKKYKIVLYLIIITIITTIAVQLYWNYRSYQGSKHRVYRQVQQSMDKSVEDYYANITRAGFITFSSPDSLLPIQNDTLFIDNTFGRGMRKKIDSTLQQIMSSDSNKAIIIEPTDRRSFPTNFMNLNNERLKSIDSLISKVYISISRDSFDLKRFDQHFEENLKRKNLELDYAISFKQRDYEDGATTKYLLRQNYISKKELNKEFDKSSIKVSAKSNFMSRSSKLSVHFNDIALIAFKKILSGILLSLLLSICVITSLIYLLRVIKNQKQLAEIKDDLISNITHELKTPITTISAALQALETFHEMKDVSKTKKYLQVSNQQVDKLNLMVEKILETATLDSEKLILNQEPTDIVTILKELIERFEIAHPGKELTMYSDSETLIANIDRFHLENAIGNIIDNAIKYGGKNIKINVLDNGSDIRILCSDDGIGIDKKQREKIFDKFYRIPTGNVHDVKGFGIGLYYTKNIIEKHNGSISLSDSSEKETIFTLTIPRA